MNKNRQTVRKIAYLGLMTSAALILSWLEAMLPPLYSAVPGIKLGLPNIVIIFILYRFGILSAACVSLLRVGIVALLFGNPMTLMYSLAGAVLSLSVMWLLKKLNILSQVAVSVAGGVFHNIGQIIVAMILLRTAEIGYYMIVLAVTGTLSGIFIGLLAALLLKKMPRIK